MPKFENVVDRVFTVQLSLSVTQTQSTDRHYGMRRNTCGTHVLMSIDSPPPPPPSPPRLLWMLNKQCNKIEEEEEGNLCVLKIVR